MKKLIVEIDDKYAGVASMTFTGGIDLWQEGGIDLTVAAVALKHDVTLVSVDEHGNMLGLETRSEEEEHIPLEKLADAVRQLEDLRNDREDCRKGFEGEESSFSKDIAAIDTAIAAMQQLAALDIAKNR